MRRALGGCLAATALLAGYARLEAPWHLLGLVCLVPFLAGLERTRGWRPALALGAVQAVGFTLAAQGWFPGAVARYTGVPAGLALALLLVAAPLLQPQLLALAAVRGALRQAGPGRAALGGALAYVGVEWAAPRLFDATLGYGLYPAEALRQAADVAGVRGLTLALLLANEALWALLRDRARLSAGRVRARALGLALPLVLAAAYGAVRWRQLDAPGAQAAPPPLRVGLVQANLTRYAELAAQLGTYGAVRTVLDTHYALSDALLAAREGAPELLVWPETVYPTTFGAPKSEAGAELDDELRAFAARARVPLLFGAYTSDGAREYNAAVLLAPGEALGQAYRKARPFPLTEYVPPALEGPRLRHLLPWLGTWSPGPGAGALTLARAGQAPLVLLPLICFDVAAPGLVAEGARRGARAIVTLANDAWFTGSAGARQHLVVAAFRSVETRLPQVRATTSGISAEIDALGRITRHTDEDRPQVLLARLAPGPGAATLAVAWGDWLGGVGLAGALALLLAPALGRLGTGARAARGRPPSR